MQDIKGDNTIKREEQKLNEASICQLNEIYQSPRDGTKGPLSLHNLLESDSIPKGHGIPKRSLTSPLEPIPAVTTSGPPSLTYAPTLLTQESEPAPLQRHDSNEATCDSNSQHSAESSVVSSAESLTHPEATFNPHVATGMSQHFDGPMIPVEEDLSLTQEEESSLKLKDEVTAVLHNDLISALPFANDDDDPPHSANATHGVPDRHFPPPLQREQSTGVHGASSLHVEEKTSASMTDAVQYIRNSRDKLAPDNLGQGSAARDGRQERIILIALLTQCMFYGILLALLMLQTLHPGLL